MVVTAAVLTAVAVAAMVVTAAVAIVAVVIAVAVAAMRAAPTGLHFPACLGGSSLPRAAEARRPAGPGSVRLRPPPASDVARSPLAGRGLSRRVSEDRRAASRGGDGRRRRADPAPMLCDPESADTLSGPRWPPLYDEEGRPTAPAAPSRAASVTPRWREPGPGRVWSWSCSWCRVSVSRGTLLRLGDKVGTGRRRRAAPRRRPGLPAHRRLFPRSGWWGLRLRPSGERRGAAEPERGGPDRALPRGLVRERWAWSQDCLCDPGQVTDIGLPQFLHL
ncbi:uncharacterized protein LOC141504920 [Macrotis lagotis]|uniref:uncharacterized protein LOC141504920 n=1 Tax=Macrotis lagotis TaxID=92651 RepID=UPI003D6932B5